MPLAGTETLGARLAREGPLPVGDAIRILREVLDALSLAHAKGVVRRDIKPDNILLGVGPDRAIQRPCASLVLQRNATVRSRVIRSVPRLLPLWTCAVHPWDSTSVSPLTNSCWMPL